MKIKPHESKLKPKSLLGDEFTGLRDIDSNLVINKLEENIKQRETPIAERLKKKLLE